MDADEVREAFRDRGVVRLDGAIDPERTRRMRAAMWRHLDRALGVDEHDRASWPDGWLPVSWKSLKRNRSFDGLIDSPDVRAALDAIFDPGGWVQPKPGAQVLFTMPGPGPWVLPDGWHMDCGFEEPTWPVHAVKLFAVIDDLGPCGGGTMLLPGVHHLVDRYRATFERPPGGGKQNWQPFLRRHPPLGDLLTGASMPDGGRSLVDRRLDVDGVPVDVVELRGAPGDVVITHLHVFHTASPNTSDTPRHMIAKPVFAGPRAA